MEFAIIGAGIGGLTVAHALLGLGRTVRVFESAKTLEEVGAGVVLGANAMHVLHRLGLHDAVCAQGHPVARITLRGRYGQVLNSTDTTVLTERVGYANLAIHRAALQRVLLAALPPGTVQLGKTLTHFTEETGAVVAHFADGGVARAAALLATDGLRSRVRLQLLPTSRPRFAGYTCWRAVVDAGALSPVGLANEICETWGGRAGRFGYVPLGHGQVYWFACLNSTEPNNPALRAFRMADLSRQFASLPAPVPQLLAATRDEQLLCNDILDLEPLPHFAFGRVLLLGDAAHATTPNLGQGAGQAVEDALALATCLRNHPDVCTAFVAFDARRRPRTTRIVEQSRRIGQLAQLETPWLTALRDAAVSRVPAWANRKQMAFLYEGEGRQ